MALNINAVLRNTYNDLHALESEIKSGVQAFHHEELQTRIDKLKKNSNQIAKEFHTQDIKSLDQELQTNLLALIKRLQHSPDFSMVLGPLQSDFTELLKRIQMNVQKWKSKVEKTNNKSM